MNTNYDIIVIGAGAAGMAAAQYACRSNLKVLVLEEKAPGGQAVLIDSLENYPGYAEPVNGFDFAENMRKQAIGFGAEFASDKAEAVTKNGEPPGQPTRRLPSSLRRGRSIAASV